jgi:predicted amidophosphoribosyltransferase
MDLNISRTSRYSALPARRKPTPLERARSFAVYEGAVVRAIVLLKFEQIEPLGAWFAERLAELGQS